MKPIRNRRLWALVVAVVLGGVVDLVAPPAAHAIVGRPLTPVSYAGVARRTTRRAVAYGAYARPVAAPVVAAPVVAPPPVVVW